MSSIKDELERHAEECRQAVSGQDAPAWTGANLAGANLARANLAGADLAGAYLAGADLAGANLAGAAGIVELPVGDPRGYRAFCVQQGDGSWRVFAGCRGPLTCAQAREHWGESYNGDREIGDRYLRALRWFGRRLKREHTMRGD